jgi:hypothetical protein
MTKESFIRRVEEILWSYDRHALKINEAKHLIVEAFDEHVLNVPTDMAQKDGTALYEFLEEQDREHDAKCRSLEQ